MFLSQGRPDVQLRWTIIGVTLTAVYFLAGAHWGIEGVAASLSVLGVVTWVVSHGMANALICLFIFLFPHLGQTGRRSGLRRFDKKLKITRHFGQANS